MPVRVRYLTDPACPWSWASEPTVRRLVTDFGDELRFAYVMGGMARDYGAGSDAPGGGGDVYSQLVARWLEVADEGRMPLDPRLWIEGPIGSTYPACMAVKAAAQQAPDGGGAYLRVLREGLLCFRRKLDTTEALVEEARRAGLDVERFRVDLASNATLEAFGADLGEVRDVPDQARAEGRVRCSVGHERVPFPTLVFVAEDGRRHWVVGNRPYEDYREAAEAAGARPAGTEVPGVLDALRRFGRMATSEVEAVCDLPLPRAAAELWRLATEWRIRPVHVLTGELWEPA